MSLVLESWFRMVSTINSWPCSLGKPRISSQEWEIVRSITTAGACNWTNDALMIALNPKSTMGTVISLRHLERIESMILHSGGKVVMGGKRMLGSSELDGFDFSQGSFFPPTIVTNVDCDDELWKEEIFGPVVVVRRFSVTNFLSLPILRYNFLFFCFRGKKKASL